MGDRDDDESGCTCRLESKLPRDWCSRCIATERAFRAAEAMRAKERREGAKP